MYGWYTTKEVASYVNKTPEQVTYWAVKMNIGKKPGHARFFNMEDLKLISSLIQDYGRKISARIA